MLSPSLAKKKKRTGETTGNVATALEARKGTAMKKKEKKNEASSTAGGKARGSKEQHRHTAFLQDAMAPRERKKTWWVGEGGEHARVARQGQSSFPTRQPEEERSLSTPLLLRVRRRCVRV